MKSKNMIIIGLGNPGKKYQNTRHNIGFIAIDAIAANFQFPDFSFQSIFNAEISNGEINGKKIVLAKPQTFMNESGKSVNSLIKNLKLKIENLVVLHDDIDVPLGSIKIVNGRGSAGHKGVESIIKEMGNNDFIRIRIGILPSTGKPQNPEIFVLKNFSKEEKNIIAEVIEKIAKITESLITQGLEKTMNEFNK